MAGKERKNIRLVIILVSIFSLLIPHIGVSADIGPKPWMNFPVSWQSGTPEEISAVVLYTCSDPSCSDAHPLEELGPQHITCESSDLCTSMAYGYNTYFQLELTFASGRILSSSPIEYTKSGIYPVTVLSDTLLIEVPEPGLLEDVLTLPAAEDNPMDFELSFGAGMVILAIFALVAGAAVVLGGSTLLVILSRRSGEEDLTFQNARVPFFLVWIAALVFFLPGTVISPAVPLTVLVECAAALIYAVLRKRNLTTTGTFVLLANLLTVPVLLFIALIFGFNAIGFVILTVEILIWLVEAVVLFIVQRQTIKFHEALLLSLGLNLLSFLTGLLLPV